MPENKCGQNAHEIAEDESLLPENERKLGKTRQIRETLKPGLRKNWENQMKANFSEIFIITFHAIPKRKNFRMIKIYLFRQPDPKKDRKIASCMRQKILKPLGLVCKHIIFVNYKD